MITTRSHACYAPARRAASPSGVPPQAWPAFLPQFGVGAGEPFMPVVVRAPNDGPSDPNPPEPKPSEPRPTAPRPANDDDADAVREVPLAVPFTGHDGDGASRFADPLDAPFVPPERYVGSLKLYERKHRRIIRPRTRDRVRAPKDGHFTVYAILDPVAGEAVYVGQTGTFDQRERRHLAYWFGYERPRPGPSISNWLATLGRSPFIRVPDVPVERGPLVVSASGELVPQRDLRRMQTHGQRVSDHRADDADWLSIGRLKRRETRGWDIGGIGSPVAPIVPDHRLPLTPSGWSSRLVLPDMGIAAEAERYRSSRPSRPVFRTLGFADDLTDALEMETAWVERLGAAGHRLLNGSYHCLAARQGWPGPTRGVGAPTVPDGRTSSDRMGPDRE